MSSDSTFWDHKFLLDQKFVQIRNLFGHKGGLKGVALHYHRAAYCFVMYNCIAYNTESMLLFSNIDQQFSMPPFAKKNNPPLKSTQI